MMVMIFFIFSLLIIWFSSLIIVGCREHYFECGMNRKIYDEVTTTYLKVVRVCIVFIIIIATLFISPTLVVDFNKVLEGRELSVEEPPNVIYERVVEQFKGDR